VSAPDTADQIGFGVTHNVTIDGLLRIKLFSDTVYFYQTSQSADLIGVKVEFYSSEGRLSSTVRSLEGTYQWRTGDMEARGDVVAETPDGRRLTTSILRYDRVSAQISGTEPFVFDSPDSHLEGDGFTADPDFAVVTALGPRSGRISEAPER
jgi:LPS export ABC transporter protein LptC